jgi:hypothetical protein
MMGFVYFADISAATEFVSQLMLQLDEYYGGLDRLRNAI